jgi:hypothetical protein
MLMPLFTNVIRSVKTLHKTKFRRCKKNPVNFNVKHSD